MEIGKALEVARQLRDGVRAKNPPPEEGAPSEEEGVVYLSLVRGTRRTYLERVVHQINGTYSRGWYDACAVMIRRLVETLIIEVYEAHGLDSKIKTTSGDFFMLRELVSAILAEPTWNLGKHTRKGLPELKAIGDSSAHSRRYNAHRQDIDKVTPHLRYVVQELVALAKLK